jgi:hypothetical protein
MCAADGAGNGETQACAARRPSTSAVSPVEALKEVRDMLCGYTFAVVPHRNSRSAIVA